MGLLDDAIREHLDLKRRRGADPAEIERAEREALGPVRRGPDVLGEGAAAPEPAFEPEAEHLPDESEHWEPFEEDVEMRELEGHEEALPYEPARGPDGDPLMEDEALLHDPRDEPAPPPPPGEPPLAADSEPGQAAHPAAEPPPTPRDPHPEQQSRHVDQETEEYEVEHDDADNDVLETTPEFLQDTPDHDRLWFEQRPPRDFDFDG